MTLDLGELSRWVPAATVNALGGTMPVEELSMMRAMVVGICREMGELW